MTVDKDFFVKMRMTDPTFTVYDAVEVYCRESPDVATRLMRDDPSGPDIFSADYLEDYLSTVSRYDAFMLGRDSDYDPNCDYFTFDGYGHIKSISVADVDEMAFDYVTTTWFVDSIIDGEVDVPSDLEDIIALWGPDGAELCEDYLYVKTLGSRNARKKGCRRWTTSS